VNKTWILPLILAGSIAASELPERQPRLNSPHVHVEWDVRQPNYSRRISVDSGAMAAGGTGYIENFGTPFILVRG